tara:strand:- start:2041 stop:3033 length:993 start_codon:yes stop_codon:yes gene_type:complete
MPLQINRSFIHGLDQLLLEKGVQPATFYRQAKINPSHFNQDDKLIPFYSELRLFEIASKYFSEPDFCLKLAERQYLAVLGPAHQAIRPQATVLESICAIQENLHLSVDGVQLELKATKDMALWTIHWAEPAIANINYAQDHAMAVLCVVMRALCGENWKPRAVYFEHPELSSISGFHRFFGSPIAFNNQFTGIAFDPACLEKANKIVTGTNLDQEDRPVRPMTDLTLPAQIKNVIALFIDNDACSIEKVAHHLSMSKRTIQRRLQEEQTNFKDLVNEVRSEQALQLMRNAHYSLAEIAAMIGYSQLSAFSRSFKRWHGVSPQSWRKLNPH